MPLDRDKTGLVIIDVQGNLADAMWEKERLLGELGKLIDGAKILEIPIFWAEQMPDKLGPTKEEIAVRLREVTAPIAKKSFSCIGDDGFKRAVKESGRTQFIVAGIEAHVCVIQTVSDLLINGHEVHLIADATSSRTPENRRIGISRAKESGAIISSVEMALFELLGAAGNDQFRAISKIVK